MDIGILTENDHEIVGHSQPDVGDEPMESDVSSIQHPSFSNISSLNEGINHFMVLLPSNILINAY